MEKRQREIGDVLNELAAYLISVETSLGIEKIYLKENKVLDVRCYDQLEKQRGDLERARTLVSDIQELLGLKNQTEPAFVQAIQQENKEPMTAPVAKKGYAAISGRALVVDDEEMVRRIVANFLSDFGLRADQAANGMEALELIKKNSYEYLVTDLIMPRMSGEELVREIKKLNKPEKIKILLITGGVLPGFKSHAADEIITPEGQGFLRKPFTQQKLYNMLKRLT